jgi:hypothetical protein
MPVPHRILAATVLPFARGFAVRDVVTGSPFVTGMRLEWLRKIGARGTDVPEVVQVRAGEDLVVESEDSRDVEGLPTGVQILLPRATHADIPCISGVAEEFPGQRWQVLSKAILGEVEPTNPVPLTEQERGYRSVVFVLDGIRSNNDGWVERLSGLLSSDSTVRVVRGSYGRFSAYNFAVPITRRRTLRWFLDQYSYHLARHPELPFHFVGHSNGTYMLGQGLRHVRAIQFKRVYLAGSVLPREFDWQARTDQVAALVNVCATKDKPVAWLCSALRGVGMRDIGLGGYSGFNTLPDSGIQHRYLVGGHSVGVAPRTTTGHRRLRPHRRTRHTQRPGG